MRSFLILLAMIPAVAAADRFLDSLDWPPPTRRFAQTESPSSYRVGAWHGRMASLPIDRSQSSSSSTPRPFAMRLTNAKYPTTAQTS